MTETCWSDDSLAILRARLAAPLPPRPVIRRVAVPPAPARDPLEHARSAALAWHAAVAARDYARGRKIARGLSRTEAVALAAVLAEGIGVDASRLRMVTLARDESEGSEAA